MKMKIDTERFGKVEVDAERIIEFKKGLLGFAAYTEYVLLQYNEEVKFFCLQAIKEPGISFIVTLPELYEPDYHVGSTQEQMDELELEKCEDAQVLAVVNQVKEKFTMNLKAPLIINVENNQAVQMLCAAAPWSSCHPIGDVLSGN